MLRTILRPKIYHRLRRHYRELRAGLQSNRSVFTTIYENNHWGSNGAAFYSGFGSNETYGTPFADLIAERVDQLDIHSIADLGCGDFQIGSLITSKRPEVNYTGADVCEKLVDHLSENFKSDHVDFQTVDLFKDPLPKADACVIRQVLQHLNNKQIKTILGKVSQVYKYAFITESHPMNLTSPNLDNATGTQVRHDGRNGSGVYINLEPFNCEAEEILTQDVNAFVDGKDYYEKLVTYEWHTQRDGID